jgi:hypothetical protein
MGDGYDFFASVRDVVSDAESETELFESAVRDVEEAAKPQPKKKPLKKIGMSKSQTESKRKKLIELSKDGIVGKPSSFIRKSKKMSSIDFTMSMKIKGCHVQVTFYQHLLFQSLRHYWEVSMQWNHQINCQRNYLVTSF